MKDLTPIFSQYNNQIEIENSKQSEKCRPSISAIQKNYHKQLTELCLQKNIHKNKVLDFFDTLKNYDNDSEYFTTLNFIIDFLDRNETNFIINLDWKSGIEDLEWKIKTALLSNFETCFSLPNAADFGKNKNISNKDIFETYNSALKNKGYQISFIDTDADEYFMLIHKFCDSSIVDSFIKIIEKSN